MVGAGGVVVVVEVTLPLTTAEGLQLGPQLVA